MDKKKLTILLGAALFAIIAAFGARSLLGGGAAPQVQAALPQIVLPKGPRVLVAQRVLPAGTIITADAVGFQEWPRNMVTGAYFQDGKFEMNKLVGTVVRYPITAGQPLTTGSLVAPGDRGFLAAALAPGMRAITITVSEKSSVAGFVFPGDHVDLMLTTAVKVKQTQMSTGNVVDDRDLYATETILRNVRVLATDQSTDQETNNGKTIVHTFRTATLEVTPKIAERIEVAQQGGTLSLVLRPLADSQNDLDHAIANGSVKLKDGATGADEARAMAGAKGNLASASGGRATLMGGKLDADNIQPGSSFATAGDISRFQRRNMPATGVAAAVAAARAAALAHANEIHIMRGKDNQAVPMGANGRPMTITADGAGAPGMNAPANAAAPAMPTN